MENGYKNVRQEDVESMISFMLPDITKALMLGYAVEVVRSRRGVQMFYYKKQRPDAIEGVR